MDSMTAITTMPNPCSVSAWIQTGHGFVDFNCGEVMKGTFGFYPSRAINYDPEVQRRINNLDPVVPAILQTSMISGNIQLTGRSSAYSFPAPYAKISGTSSSASTIPAYAIPGPSSLITGTLASEGMYLGLNSYNFKTIIAENSVDGKLVDDSLLLKECLNRKFPCLVSHLNVTSEVAAKAWNKYQSIKEGIKFERQNSCPLTPLGKLRFNASNNNCIDFMRRIMDSMGISNWKKDMHYSSPPTMMNKLTAIAWHYFNWT
jgi:hypothetical protein